MSPRPPSGCQQIEAYNQTGNKASPTESRKNAGSSLRELQSYSNLAEISKSFMKIMTFVFHLQGRFLESRGNPSNICLEAST